MVNLRIDKLSINFSQVSEDDYYLKLNARALYYCTQSDIDEITEIIDEEDEENIRLWFQIMLIKYSQNSVSCTGIAVICLINTRKIRIGVD